MRLATSRLAPSTMGSYGQKWAQFQAFCAERGLSALPASTATCARYLGYLRDRGGVKPESLQPYLSVINTVHKEVLFMDPGPAAGPLINSIRGGWRQERARFAPEERSDQRVYLPAAVALQALHRVLADADARVRGAPLLPLAHLRCLVYLALGFQCMFRACTDAALLAEDVQLTDLQLVVRVRKEKGKDQKAQRRVLAFDARNVPLLARALRHWAARRDELWRAVPAASPLRVAASAADGAALAPVAAHYFLLPCDGAAAPAASPSALCTAWAGEAFRLLGVSPPAGFKWTSHSLRMGAASAAKAERWDLEHIRFYGGWAPKSGVVLDYINLLVTPDEGSGVFFGWRP